MPCSKHTPPLLLKKTNQLMMYNVKMDVCSEKQRSIKSVQHRVSTMLNLVVCKVTARL